MRKKKIVLTTLPHIFMHVVSSIQTHCGRDPAGYLAYLSVQDNTLKKKGLEETNDRVFSRASRTSYVVAKSIYLRYKYVYTRYSTPELVEPALSCHDGLLIAHGDDEANVTTTPKRHHTKVHDYLSSFLGLKRGGFQGSSRVMTRAARRVTSFFKNLTGRVSSGRELFKNLTGWARSDPRGST